MKTKYKGANYLAVPACTQHVFLFPHLLVCEPLVCPLNTILSVCIYYNTRRRMINSPRYTHHLVCYFNTRRPVVTVVRHICLHFIYIHAPVNQTPDLCCHAPFSCGYVALSDHYLFISYAMDMLAERLNKRASFSLTC